MRLHLDFQGTRFCCAWSISSKRRALRHFDHRQSRFFICQSLQTNSETTQLEQRSKEGRVKASSERTRTAATVTEVETAESQESVLNDGKLPPQKADLYLVRTDGLSCSRETVRASGCLAFAHPSTQQHLLVWKSKPKCVLVLKKLGSDLFEEMLEVINYLGKVEGMRVIVEPQEYEALAGHPQQDFITTFGQGEVHRLHRHVDFVTCLGGDGVVLHASSLFQRAMPPLIAFNLGSLGFLTNHFYENYIRDLKGVIYGREDLEQCCLDMEDGLAILAYLPQDSLCTSKII